MGEFGGVSGLCELFAFTVWALSGFSSSKTLGFQSLGLKVLKTYVSRNE